MPEAKPHVLDKEIKGSLPGDRGGQQISNSDFTILLLVPNTWKSIE